eukprot:m.184180 g.184180  ORF g.184180 m.184180 type:complete len:504 (+) comp16902_c0_seq1:154-1665(+)
MGGCSSSKLALANFTVWTGTWNLGNSTPPEELDWIPKGKYDIYALGVQESVYMEDDAKNPMANEAHFSALVDAAIGEGYKEVCCQTLSPRTDKTFQTQTAFKDAVNKGDAKSSGIRLMVWVRNRIADTYEVDTGVLFQTCGRLDGLSGNKGGIACTLNIGGARLAFITAHLNAHMHELERRNQDYEKLNRELHDTNDTYGTQRKARAANAQDLTYHVEVMNRNDAVFWFGDLNYRVQPLADIEAIEEMKKLVYADIKSHNWAGLLAHDQLKAQQKAQTAFHGFEEASIDFAPTFKLNTKSQSLLPKDRYKKRVPSYCDRVLWRAPSANVKVKCDRYQSHPTVYTSDHHPVSATFKLSVPAFPSSYPHAEDVGFVITLSKLILLTRGSQSPLVGSEGTAVIIAGHPMGVDQASSQPSSTKEPRQWEDGDRLRITVPQRMYELQRHPLLVVLKDPTKDNYVDQQLGEGMISLMNLRVSVFRVELYQGGKPFGVLSGAVNVRTLDA